MTPLVEGEFFHIYNRGNSKQEIFLDEEDYFRFIKLLYLSNSIYNINFRNDIVKKHISAFDFERGESLVNIGAYVLMPNHFHIYLSPKPRLGPDEELNNVAKFMLKLCTSYSKYFNKKYNRTGKLFEDKFKSVHIVTENQAKYLFSYIHLNPIKLIQSDWKENGIKNKDKALKFLHDYKWSSLDYYQGVQKDENKILSLENFVNYFPDPESFRKEIFEWLSKGDWS
jgi:putative transposase